MSVWSIIVGLLALAAPATMALYRYMRRRPSYLTVPPREEE